MMTPRSFSPTPNNCISNRLSINRRSHVLGIIKKDEDGLWLIPSSWKMQQQNLFKQKAHCTGRYYFAIDKLNTVILYSGENPNFDRHILYKGHVVMAHGRVKSWVINEGIPPENAPPPFPIRNLKK